MDKMEQTGGTGVDYDGVLLRSKLGPHDIEPDPAIVADDEANYLYLAGALSGSADLMKQTWRQLGLTDDEGNPTPRMILFMRSHREWLQLPGKKVSQLLDTPEKARAYVEERLK